jgi:hypothetical protein
MFNLGQSPETSAVLLDATHWAVLKGLLLVISVKVRATCISRLTHFPDIFPGLLCRKQESHNILFHSALPFHLRQWYIINPTYISK